jgi:hypothetical protein
MTIKELNSLLNFIVLNAGDETKEITKTYCCDLLSFVMGKAPAGCAWITVMGNVNSIAVATLADISCIILADSVELDKPALSKAEQHNITVLQSDAPIFETALAVHNAITNA